MSRQLLLYTTAGCHLCETALELLHQARASGFDLEVCEVEISESESLMEAYGVRIPVIRFAGDTRELGWPFTYEELVPFIDNALE